MTRLLLAVAIAALVTNCGRRSAPEAPPLAQPAAAIDGADESRQKVPDRPFLLDPLVR